MILSMRAMTRGSIELPIEGSGRFAKVNEIGAGVMNHS